VRQLLLAASILPNSADVGGRTALHLAAANNHASCIRALLVAGASACSKDVDGATPLHAASSHGHVAAITALLAAPGAVSLLACMDGGGRTALHSAAERGHDEAARALLQHGAAPNCGEGSDSGCPLHQACQAGHAEVVELLLQHGASVGSTASDGSSPLLWAARNGRAATTRVLLAAGAAVGTADCNGDTALHQAVRSWETGKASQYTATVKALLEAKADPLAANRCGDTPLSLAAGKHISELQKLLQEGATPGRSACLVPCMVLVWCRRTQEGKS
jgi:ankyrin